MRNRYIKLFLVYIILIAVILILRTITVQAQEEPKQEVFLPWRNCGPSAPVPGASDNSEGSVCTDAKGNRWELVIRSNGRKCESILSARKDGYRHFMCSEQYELMIRPEKKNEK